MGGGLGRRFSPDVRDTRHMMRAIVPQAPATKIRKFWNQGGIWLNQGDLPHCVGYSWVHLLEDGPIMYPKAGPALDPNWLYYECKKIDGFAGIDGSTVRAGADVLLREGWISEYRWAWDVGTVIDCLLMKSPVELGVNWYEGFDTPGPYGRAKISGSILGGHAFKLDGINTQKELVRAKQSWYRSWGDKGRFWFSLSDLDRLIKEDGEACMAVEVRKEG